MVYNSLNFILLFPLLFILYYAIPALHVRGRNGYLLLVSYLLYIQWEPMHALILLGVTGGDLFFRIVYGKDRASQTDSISRGVSFIAAVGFLQVLRFCKRKYKRVFVFVRFEFPAAGVELGHSCGYLVFYVSGVGLPMGCLLQEAAS